MKKSNKFLSVLLAVCMVLSLSVPAFAAESASTEETLFCGGYTITIIKGVHLPAPRDLLILPQTDYKSSSAYEKTIQCISGYGDTLNFWVNNTRGTSDLTIRFTVNGDTAKTTLDAGTQYTYIIRNSDGGEMSAAIGVYIGAASGAVDITVSARQYYS